MRHVCIECGLSSADGNLWCQRKECSAQYLNYLFRSGDRLGELEIKNLLRVMRTAAVYEAERGKEKVLLKVAHIGEMYIDDIRREAEYLRKLGQRFSGDRYPKFLPHLAAPYSGVDLYKEKMPYYGRLAFRDQLRYYEVFDYVRGFFLRDLLDDNPQPEYNYAGWLSIGLIEVLNFMKGELGVHHLALSPEVIYARIDDAGVYYPVLLDLGLGQSLRGQIPAYRQIVDDASAELIPAQFAEWLIRHQPPAYIAPELYSGAGSEQTDVYGIGLIFYEMLAGHPAFEGHNANDGEFKAVVQANEWRPLPHKEPELNLIVNRALGKADVQPYRTLDEISVTLLQVFGNVPAETKREGWWNYKNQQRLMVLGLVVLAVLIILALPTALATFAAPPP